MFNIDADIRRARTLSSDFYTRAEFFEQSRESIFARSWQFLGHRSEFTGITPRTLLEGFVSEPVLVVQYGDQYKCLSNVCTHRGKILVEAPCEANLIRCGYHGRRFSLDGKFLSMPEFGGVEDFPSAADDLTQLPIAEWNGFLFTSIEPFADFDAVIHGLPEPAVEFSLSEPRSVSRTEYEVAAHWALYCENYLEGFHIPYVHKGLNAIVDYGTYATETARYASVQTGFDTNGKLAARYVFVFPNLMFNFYPWGISVNVVRPISAGRSIIEFLTYVSDSTLAQSGAGADLHSVEMEDEAVVEAVQKGIRSRFYTHGRYSPSREKGTHHFHRLIAEFMRCPENE